MSSSRRGSRASKPKVRTGCITWIRRVKCGEEKPACLRCTSTGRVCDGYDPTSTPRVRAGNASALSRCCVNRSTAPRLILPLIADIPGNPTERVYFHRFRQLAGQAMGLRVGTGNNFWDKTIPQYCHKVPAIRHAFIAFGAAYHHFQVSSNLWLPTNTPDTLETFVLKQYNLALRSLKEELANGSMGDRYVVILTCCIAFFCIDILRNQWQAALSHLSSGIRMITNLPEEAQTALNELAPMKVSPRIQTSGVNYLTKMLSHLELSGGFFVTNFRPSLSIHIYNLRKYDTTTLPEFDTLGDLHEAVDNFCYDTYALMWLNRSRRGDAKFWAQPEPALQFSILQRRSERLSELMDRFEKRPGAFKSGTREYLSFLLSKLYFRGLVPALKLLPQEIDTTTPPTTEEIEDFNKCLDLVEHIQDEYKEVPGPGHGRRFNLDQGVISSLWAVASQCRDAGVRKRTLEVIVNWPSRENLWDGPMLKAMIQLASEKKSIDQTLALSAVNFGIEVPTLVEMLKNVQLDSPEGIIGRQ